MTSNMGSRELIQERAEGGARGCRRHRATEVMEARVFRPEFLNRIDDIIVFIDRVTKEIHFTEEVAAEPVRAAC
jgi:ATP-dependent Clp protease ATP-binding subunit ClpA